MDEQKNQILFFQLILSFHAAAMQQMGKLKNPFTDKIERDLKQAQLSIDMIDMIKEKTEGRLTDEETDFLERTQRELKLNYVEEMNKEETKVPEADKPTPKPEEASPAADQMDSDHKKSTGEKKTAGKSKKK